MNIDRIEIKKLYGYIDKEIDFNKDITLLVGINGSGKTSVLNLITWLIKPSLSHLCVIQFKLLRLKFTYKGVGYIIECKQFKSSLKYSIKSDNENESYHPLSVKLHISPTNLGNDDYIKNELIQRYANLTPTKEEEKTWEFVNELPNPVIVGLDRNLYTEEPDRDYIEETIRGKIYLGKKEKQKASPLKKVKDIVNTEYRISKNSILTLTNDLKNHLMLSAFQGNFSLSDIRGGVNNKLTINQIESAEKRVNDYFTKYEKRSYTEKHQATITNYFSQLKAITKQFAEKSASPEVKTLFALNSNQFGKLKKLLLEFEKFEEASEKILSRIQLFLNTINYFLRDSSKQLLFKEDTSELVYNATNKNGEVVKKFEDLNNLSSGEQQILILFSYLAFNSSDGKLFIIDEPELSLHIKWQEDFLDALSKITPKSTQIILATHSPILVGKKKDNAVLLLPYNE